MAARNKKNSKQNIMTKLLSSVIVCHVRGLTHPQTQQVGVVLADPDSELRSLCDGLGHFVVDTAVKLEDHQVVLLLSAGIRHVPETQKGHELQKINQ